MAGDSRAFVEAYGRAMPPALKALYDNRELLASAPHRVPLPRKAGAVEVQYYRVDTGLIAEDVAGELFAFAVDWDGWDMLVDLNGPGLPVLRREAGEIDRLDFTLVEFLAAATRPTVGQGSV
ncbi:MAG TPA: hypothetical protein VMZ71_00235 [Gemmataceae bacterium]|nr:hypothetical protein [Gemmataceae bacterium]